jgi:hypothetical protein
LCGAVVLPTSQKRFTMTASLSAPRLLLLAIVVIKTWKISDSFNVSARNFKCDHSSTELLATPSRRHMLGAMLVGGSNAIFKSPAIAAYGDASNMKGFDYINYLMEKNAVADPSTFVYKGADRSVQLQRIQDAISALQQIPALAQAKKWSQVNGVLTGPLGTLIPTMTQIVSGTNLTRQDFGAAPLPVNKEAKAALLKVKTDIYAIGQAALKKSETGCIQATDAALNDLEAFVKVSF